MWSLVHWTDWDGVVSLSHLPFSPSFTPISPENKKYLNLQSGLWFTGLIETGLSVLHERKRDQQTYSRHGNQGWECEWKKKKNIRWRERIRQTEWEFSWQLQSCRSTSCLRWSCSKNEGRGILRRYSDISNYHHFFHFNRPSVHTHSGILGCHQSERLKILSCQFTIKGLDPMTATCDKDTEPITWSLKTPAARTCLKWICCINQLVIINQIKVNKANKWNENTITCNHQSQSRWWWFPTLVIQREKRQHCKRNGAALRENHYNLVQFSLLIRHTIKLVFGYCLELVLLS